MIVSDIDLRKSGAVRAVCMAYTRYADGCGGWRIVREWAEREFRQFDSATMDRLIELAMQARDKAIDVCGKSQQQELLDASGNFRLEDREVG